MKGRPIHVALYFLLLVRGIVWVLFLAYLCTFIYSLINTEAFSNIVVEDAFQADFKLGNFRSCSECSDKHVITISEIGTNMKLWLLVRGLIFFILVLLSIQALIRVTKSILKKSTFYDQNIDAFMYLYKLGLAIAIFSSFNFFIQGEADIVEFSIPFGVIGYSLGCRLLAEIFKEGKKLAEENNSII